MAGVKDANLIHKYDWDTIRKKYDMAGNTGACTNMAGVRETQVIVNLTYKHLTWEKRGLTRNCFCSLDTLEQLIILICHRIVFYFAAFP